MEDLPGKNDAYTRYKTLSAVSYTAFAPYALNVLLGNLRYICF